MANENVNGQGLEGYCFKCREKRIMVGPNAEWAKNGSPGTRGTCPVCAGTIYKTGHTPAHETLPKPEVLASPTKTGSRKKKTTSKKKATPKKKAAPKKSPGQSNSRHGKLVIVESPAKAKTIGRYLGRGYTVKSSVGHVRDLLKSRLSVDVDNHFEPEYRVPNDKRKVVKDLKTAAEKAKEIYLATDPDREGEAIAWHVAAAAEMEPERIQRVVFQEITKQAVQEAFNHPRDIDMDRVDAQQARRILDRLVGYKLSPLLWRKVRGRLSAGRVQSVAVRLVVEREREIEDFEPEEYWTLEANVSREKHRPDKPRPYFSARFHKYKNHDPDLSSEAKVKPHLDKLAKATWAVGKVRVGQRKRRPAAPFTTSTLQQEASRRLSFGTSKSMRIAQQLYEGVDIGNEGTVGLITYMRTDSVTVSTQAQAQARDYIAGEYGNNYMPEKPPVYRTKSKLAQEAHEAIRPTAVFHTPPAMKQYLSRDQYRLYTLIWQRFVASQMADAIYDTVSADIYAGDKETPVVKRPYLFRAAGSTLRFAGFLALYEESNPSDRPDDDQNQVPADLSENEALDLLKLLPEQHFTQPPPRFSEATLVKELEENGIGRPSTYASIISTIQKRGYAAMEEKRLVPTETGLVVNDLLVEHFPNVLSVDFTARMEDSLDDIAQGKPWVPVVDSFYQDFEINLKRADEALPKINLRAEPELVGRECPLCNSPLVYREGRYGRFIGCSKFPTCRHTEQILVKVGVNCPNCGGDLIEKSTKSGRKFYGCANYPECEWTNWKKPLPQPCPLCGGLLVQATRKHAECTVCGERQSLPEPAHEAPEPA